MATCLELGQALYPTTFRNRKIRPHESVSLVPAISGREQPREHAYYFHHGGSHALIQGDWKVVREGKGNWALYNLRDNRTETVDLAGEFPELVEAMVSKWTKRYP